MRTSRRRGSVGVRWRRAGADARAGRDAVWIGRVRCQGVGAAIQSAGARGARDDRRLPGCQPGAECAPGRPGPRPRTAVSGARRGFHQRASPVRRARHLDAGLGPIRAARVRARSPARGARWRPRPPMGRREGRHAPGGGPLRLPLRPRRERRHQGRGDRAHLARRRPGPSRPGVSPHARRAATHPGARSRPARGVDRDRLLERSIPPRPGGRGLERSRPPSSSS